MQLICWIIAAILMTIAAFWSPPRPVLATLAWAFFIWGFVFSIGHLSIS